MDDDPANMWAILMAIFLSTVALVVVIFTVAALFPASGPSGPNRWVAGRVLRMTQGTPLGYSYQDDTITARLPDGTITFVGLDSGNRDALWGYVVVGDTVREHLMGTTVCAVQFADHQVDSGLC